MNEPIRFYGFADEASAAVDGQIRAMKRNRMDGLEIRGTEYGSVANLTIEQAKEIRRKLDDAGLILWSVGSPIGKYRIELPFAPHLEAFKRTLEIAEILGARRFRLFSFRPPKGEDPKIYKEEVLERIGGFVEAAENRDIRLCHENEKRIYGDTPERCLDILKTFPEIRATFDFANFVQCDVDTLKAWEMLKPYVDYIHVKDAMPDHLVVPAGKGAGHLKEIIGDYIAQGGRTFTLEPHLWVFDGLEDLEKLDERTKEISRSYGNADKAFDTAAEAFRNLLSEL